MRLDFINQNKTLLANFSYVSILQFFLIVAPLVTYPYLVRVLGLDLYGYVIMAQVLASYASIIIDFGTNSVCSKHVSINRGEKKILSEIVSSVLIIRTILWLGCFFLYALIIYLIPTYRQYYMLFLFSYGLTTNELLFPQYFFQGIEKMKYSTIINILIKIFFITLIFIVVKSPDDYLYVPLLTTAGYFFGGFYAIWLIFCKMGLKFYIPSVSSITYYIKDSMAIFATDVVCTIKDKFNYLLLGTLGETASVVVYDLGLKIYNMIGRPASIISIVFFPRSAKVKNIKQFNKILILIVVIDVVLIILTNLFLPYIVKFFLNEHIDLMPIRLFTLAPLFSTTSAFIISNLCIAYGYNKYVLYSILFTTSIYVLILSIMYITNYLNNLYAFVLLAVIGYFTEFIYRIYVYKKIVKLEKLL